MSRAEETAWETLVSQVTHREHSSDIQVTMPTDQFTESQLVFFKVRACYKGGFSVESSSLELQFPGVGTLVFWEGFVYCSLSTIDTVL